MSCRIDRIPVGRSASISYQEGLHQDGYSHRSVAIAVACNTSFDIIIGDFCINHCFYTSFIAEFGIFARPARFEEFGQANAQDVGVAGRILRRHCSSN